MANDLEAEIVAAKKGCDQITSVAEGEPRYVKDDDKFISARFVNFLDQEVELNDALR